MILNVKVPHPGEHAGLATAGIVGLADVLNETAE
jgi:hypothetical protein